jgi:hypothetical protein
MTKRSWREIMDARQQEAIDRKLQSASSMPAQEQAVGSDDIRHNIDVNQLTSDEAIWSYLVGKHVRTNIIDPHFYSRVTLAQVTESFLIFQWKNPNGSTVTAGWSRDYVLKLLFGYRDTYQTHANIQLDQSQLANVASGKKSRRGGGVGVGFAVPIG